MAARILGPDQISQAANMLRAGKLVAFPTDTVYGVASIPTAWTEQEPANFAGQEIELGHDPDSLYLRKFKGGRRELFSLHCGSVQGALTFTSPRTHAEVRVLQALAPAGVTVVVRWHSRSLGVRVVQHPLGSAFLDACEVPVLATSANLHGQPPLMDPAAIAQLPGLDAVLDGGVLPARPASTVVRLLPAGLQVLRRGAVDDDGLARAFTRDLQFVCLGNLNRSAFAAGLVAAMQQWLAQRLTGFVPAWRVRSCGIIANPQAKVPPEMLSAALLHGVDLSGHVPTRFAGGGPADELDIAMGDDAAAAVETVAQGEVVNLHVQDPMGGPPAAYQAAAQAITMRLHFEVMHEWAPQPAKEGPGRDQADAALEAEFRRRFLAAARS